MRFALLGSHPDGLDMASALVDSGRHQLLAYSSPAVPADYLAQWGPAARPVGDLEEVLANPDLDAVLVAGTIDNRPVQLRRALQSERHVLCVYPADRTPDVAYEAAMIQADTHKVLFPLLPHALHPGVVQLAQLLRGATTGLGRPVLIEMELRGRGQVLLEGAVDARPTFPGWDVLRALGGEIAEVSAFASAEEVTAAEPIFVAGRFDGGGLFRASFLPGQPDDCCRVTVTGNGGRTELLFPLGWNGPAYLGRHDDNGRLREEGWTTWDPWPVLVAAFEAAVAGQPATPAWQDAIRSLELDDAVRRSVARRRSTVLEYPEATEEAGFKGTMTLVGCGLLWGLLALLIVANWFPSLFWVGVPLLVFFLGLQLLRWLVPSKKT